MTNSKDNTLNYRGMTINHEGKKLNYVGEKASCTNSPLQHCIYMILDYEYNTNNSKDSTYHHRCNSQ